MGVLACRNEGEEEDFWPNVTTTVACSFFHEREPWNRKFSAAMMLEGVKGRVGVKVSHTSQLLRQFRKALSSRTPLDVDSCPHRICPILCQKGRAVGSVPAPRVYWAQETAEMVPEVGLRILPLQQTRPGAVAITQRHRHAALAHSRLTAT